MATTQTLAPKARIWPSIDKQTEIAKTIRTIGARLEVQWNGTDWVDESDYFLTAQGNIQMSGNLGEGLAAEADFELDNTTKRFLPENSASPIYSYLKPRVNIRFDVKIGSYYFRLFTGYIKAIEPNRKQGIVNFQCFDNTVKVLDKPAPREAAYINKRGDELIKILAESVDITADEYDLEISEHIISAAYFGEKKIWPLMGEIVVSERGRIFFDYDGKLKFWNKSHIQNQQNPIFTITRDDWIENLEFSIAEQAIKNKVTVKARPRVSMGIQVVWTNGDIEILNQYSDTLVWIPANDQQSAYIQVEDEIGPLPCTTWIQPIAYTDYVANTKIDGSGVDKTDSVKVTTFTPYADTCFLIVQNYADVPVYLTRFEIRANPLKIQDWIRVIKKDEASIELYDEQSIELENDFIDKEEWAEEIARVELARWKDAKNLFRVDILGHPEFRVGDILKVELTEGNYENYMIYNMDWEVNERGFLQTIQFVNPLAISTEQLTTARANISGTMTQTIAAKATIVSLRTIQVKSSIKKSASQSIQSLSRILIT